MNKECEVIRDLLPLYADDVCSVASRNIIAEHLAGTVSAFVERMNQRAPMPNRYPRRRDRDRKRRDNNRDNPPTQE